MSQAFLNSMQLVLTLICNWCNQGFRYNICICQYHAFVSVCDWINKEQQSVKQQQSVKSTVHDLKIMCLSDRALGAYYHQVILEWTKINIVDAFVTGFISWPEQTWSRWNSFSLLKLFSHWSVLHHITTTYEIIVERWEVTRWK